MSDKNSEGAISNGPTDDTHPPSTESDHHLLHRDDEQLIENNANHSYSQNNKLESTLGLDDANSLKHKPQICGVARGLALIIILSAVFALGVTTALILHIYIGEHEIALHGGVSTESTPCSHVGVQVLKDEGSAVDAAIAALFCLAVTEGQHSGIGGGGFMLIHDHAKNTSSVIDFRETAPLSISKDTFYSQNAQTKAGLYVGVPGMLRGLKLAHEKHGKLPWKRLIDPSIEIAKNGFKLSSNAVVDLQSLKPEEKALFEKTNLGKIFIKNGEIVGESDTITRPDLAETYRIISTSERGVEEFYNGSLSQGIIDAITKSGGIMTLDDLASYKPVEREALLSVLPTNDANYTIVTMPLPGGGPALIHILNLVSAFNWTLSDLNSPHRYYQLIEAFRYTYAARSGLGDPAFPSKILTKFNASLTSLDEAKKIAELISSRNETLDLSEYPHAGPLLNDGGTTHVSVVDPDEMFVSVTASINNILGSKIMTKSGIILNDHMRDFSQDPNSVNSMAGGKRPLSGMTPTVLFHNTQACGPRLAIGGINGANIIAGVAETIINHLVFGMTLQDAINRPRIINTLDQTTFYENALTKNNSELVEALTDYGYTLQGQARRLSFVLATCKVNDTISVVTDPGEAGQTPEKF